MLEENPDDVRAGAANLRKPHRDRAPVRRLAGGRDQRLPRRPRLRARRHPRDRRASAARGCAVTRHVAEGGDGAPRAGRARRRGGRTSRRRSGYLYDLDDAPVDKIETIATRDLRRRRHRPLARGGARRSRSSRARLRRPPRSSSPRPTCRSPPTRPCCGAPTGWRMPVREVRAAVGAGYVYAICGDMRTMPGLPQAPGRRAHRHRRRRQRSSASPDLPGLTRRRAESAAGDRGQHLHVRAVADRRRQAAVVSGCRRRRRRR